MQTDESSDSLPDLQEEQETMATPLAQAAALPLPGATTVNLPTGATTATSTTTTAPTAVQITFGGTTYTVRDIATPNSISKEAAHILHPKGTRDKLSEDERAKLFEKAGALAHKKYEIMPLSLEDADKLDDTYNLDVLIKYTRRSHIKYDLHDVFLIVYPKTGAQANVVDYTKDLYTEYPDITIEDVARSNEWYRKWMNEACFAQNLQLTYSFFQNNVSEDLWMKVSETYESYTTGEQGGPLFFILMMNHLLSDTEEAASSLVQKVKTFEIKKVIGEDISKVVSLLRGAINRLTSIHKLPDDIVKVLLGVFQTTSVDEFNATFNLLAKQRKQSAVLRQTGASTGITASHIFTLAESEYRDMMLDNKWTGVLTTGESAFNAGMGNDRFKPECFNCGGDHHAKECKKPRDEKRIQESMTKFRNMLKKKRADGGNDSTNKKKKKWTGGNKKWAPPQPHEHSKRNINGAAMWYNKNTKRWVPDKESNSPGAHVAGANQPAAETPPATVPSDNVSMANQLKALQATFTSFKQQMLLDDH
jgi:hypothetical protein